MDVEMVVLRLLHIMVGVFWAGTAFFASSHLIPAVRATWPQGARVMARLFERRIDMALMGSGMIAILAGLRLYWRDAAGTPMWVHSPAGVCYGLGGLAAIVALVLGGVMIRPAGRRLLGALRASEAAASDTERGTSMAEAEAAYARLTSAIRIGAAFLGITVVLMAIARYV